MAESMKGLKRTYRCGELSLANVGEEVTVMGWVQKQRNKGGIIFVDLRDRAGILHRSWRVKNWTRILIILRSEVYGKRLCKN